MGGDFSTNNIMNLIVFVHYWRLGVEKIDLEPLSRHNAGPLKGSNDTRFSVFKFNVKVTSGQKI